MSACTIAITALATAAVGTVDPILDDRLDPGLDDDRGHVTDQVLRARENRDRNVADAVIEQGNRPC